jgi:predicted nucleic acid-binding Zn ribbon protein
MMRGAYYNALADYHGAFDAIASSPEKAHDSLARAAVGFRHAQQADLAAMVESHIEDVQTKRHCWTCGREMQGRNYHFRYYPATASEYERNVVEARKEDSGMLDRAGSVTLCAVCGSAIERQADEYASRRAGEVQTWARERFASQSAEIAALKSRVSSLENSGH